MASNNGVANKFLSRFSVSPATKFEGNCPYFRQPKEVGCFSLDIDRDFHDDSSKLRYYSPGEGADFDLSVGYKCFIRRDEDKKDRLDDLLKWIIRHPEKFRVRTDESEQSMKSDDHSLHTDFVTWRGHITKIFCTPYERKEPWQMALRLFNSTIYISEVETDEARQSRLSKSERQDKMCYWGYKFEDYVTIPVNSNSAVKNSNHELPINNKEAYCSVVRSRLDKHSLIYGAEVDCCSKQPQNKKCLPPDNYLELKTSRVIENDRMNWSFERYKLLKWWSQSFLAGIPRVVCGFRDDDGVVKQLKTFRTLEIPKLVADGGNNMWVGAVCLNFCNQLLDWMKSLVKDEDVIYMLHWREPFTHIEMEISRNTTDKFLPNWYIHR